MWTLLHEPRSAAQENLKTLRPEAFTVRRNFIAAIFTFTTPSPYDPRVRLQQVKARRFHDRNSFFIDQTLEHFNILPQNQALSPPSTLHGAIYQQTNTTVSSQLGGLGL